MPYLPASLLELIFEGPDPTWPISFLRKIFACIVLGVETCHLAGVAHMDIKLSNVNLT